MKLIPNGDTRTATLPSFTPDPGPFCLRLFITGSTPKSIRALTNVKRICETYLLGRYTLEVVDIYQQPYLAKREQIIATPTLVRERPLPIRKFIGDMSNTRRILCGFDLLPSFESGEAHAEV